MYLLLSDWKLKFVTAVAAIILCDYCNTVAGISLGERAQKYVDELIQTSDENSQHFSHCPFNFPPLPSPGSAIEDYFLPKVMLWSPKEQFQIALNCPLHGNDLHPNQWTRYVSGKGGEKARLIYDFMEDIVLVQRIYRCGNDRQGHKLRATTPDVHNLLPGYIQEFFPLEIFQRCGVSKAMVHFFDIQILEGVSFLKISEGLASLNYRQYLQRKRIYFSARKGNMCSVPDIAEFHNNPLYSFPSNDQIMKIFLHNF